MINQRKSLSKRARFEIFKRDGFTCQYCGQRPPDVVLEVDHIDPVAAGGTNDEINLITSCAACNNGKGARQLHDRAVRPDTDLEYLGVQQEIAEARRFLDARKVRDEIQRELVTVIQRYWHENIRLGLDPEANEYVPDDTVVRNWLAYASPDQICEAIRLGGVFAASQARNFNHALRYVSGILHRIRSEE